MKNMDLEKLMKILLWLIALHSFAVGILLMVLPPDIMMLFGYDLVNERFFQIQAGVFHIVMVLAYVMAAVSPSTRRVLVEYIYRVKFMATIFLILYTVFAVPLLTVLLSGLGDFAMGLAVLFLHRMMLRDGLYA